MVVDTTEARERLGQIVSDRRRTLGLSLSAAARAAGIDRATWTGMERGTRRTEEYNYASIDRALRWAPGSVDRVLAGGEPEPQEPSRSIPQMDLVYEVRQVITLDVADHTKLELVQRVLDLYERAQSER